MNLKQKYFYTALGAVIMLIGIGVGSIVSPPLIAQDTPEKGVFSEVECRRLVVLDKAGNKAVALYAEALGNSVALYNSEGKRAVILSAGKRGRSNSVTIRNKSAKNTINLFVSEQLGTSVSIKNPVGKGRIRLSARESGSRISVADKAGNVLWEAPVRKEGAANEPK